MRKYQLVNKIREDGYFYYEDEMISRLKSKKSPYPYENNTEHTKYKVMVSGYDEYITEDLEDAVDEFLRRFKESEIDTIPFEIYISDILYHYPDDVAYFVDNEHIELFDVILKIGRIKRDIIDFEEYKSLFSKVSYYEDGDIDLHDFRFDFKLEEIKDDKIFGKVTIY